MANMDFFQNNLLNISSGSNVLNNLTELNIALSNLPTSNINSIASELSLDIIFDCINSSEIEQISVACSVLRIFLNALEPGHVLNRYGVHMMRALNHPELEVKLFVMEQLNRACLNSGLILSNDLQIIQAVINCICEPPLSVAQSCIKFLVSLSNLPAGLAAIFNPQALRLLETEMLVPKSVFKSRIVEMLVKISVSSPANLDACYRSGLFKLVFESLMQDADPLANAVVISILTELALTHHGLKYLEEQGVVQFLAEKFKAENEFSNDVPSYIRFFGNIAHLQPGQTFQKYPTVIQKIFHTVLSENRTLASIAIETISYIGSTSQGKRLFNSLDSEMTIVIERIAELIKTMPTEEKVLAMNALANILKLEETDFSEDLFSITKKWFYKLGDKPMDRIMNICKQPFVETRCAGFLVLKSLVNLPWGLEEIVHQPGLLEFLLDRSGDATMQCKSDKYEVNKQIIAMPQAKEILPAPIYLRLVEYVRQGPVYIPVQTEIAIDGV